MAIPNVLALMILMSKIMVIMSKIMIATSKTIIVGGVKYDDYADVEDGDDGDFKCAGGGGDDLDGNNHHVNDINDSDVENDNGWLYHR